MEAHSGTYGNDRADLLAKIARESKQVDPSIGLHISQDPLKERISHWELDEWNTELDQEKSNWNQMPFLWDTIKSESRGTMKRIIELLTGHGNFRDMLIKKGQSTKSKCRCCNSDTESNSHFWRHCPETQCIRNKICPDEPKNWVLFAKELLKNEKIAQLLRENDI